MLAEGAPPQTPASVAIADHLIGYKEYDTGRTYMAKMGNWRENKDEELELDGIGGVNIIVKADVHKSGMVTPDFAPSTTNA